MERSAGPEFVARNQEANLPQEPIWVRFLSFCVAKPNLFTKTKQNAKMSLRELGFYCIGLATGLGIGFVCLWNVSGRFKRASVQQQQEEEVTVEHSVTETRSISEHEQQ